MSIQTTYPDAPAAMRVNRLADNGAKDGRSVYNAEASDSLPFGTAVMHAAGGRATADLPLPVVSPETAAAGNIAGILLMSDDLIKGVDADDTGLKAKSIGSALAKGRGNFVCANGCVAGDPLYIRIAAGAIGELRSAADGANTIDCSAYGRWLTNASAAGVATLEVAFEA